MEFVLTRKEMQRLRVRAFIPMLWVGYVAFEVIFHWSSGIAWLSAAWLAALVAYGLKPAGNEKGTTAALIRLLIIFGGYLSAFALPAVLAASIAGRWASVICVSLYVAFCWFFVFRRVNYFAM